jgi:hypothetical protein
MSLLNVSRLLLEVRKVVMGGREDRDAESVGRASGVSTFDCYHFIPALGWLIIICCG